MLGREFGNTKDMEKNNVSNLQSFLRTSSHLQPELTENQPV